MVVHVTSPAPRTSLDCEQAARALLDDLTQAGYGGEYQSWVGSLPAGASDVQPGEQWNITVSSFGLSCPVVVREVEIGFQNLSDEYAQFKLQFANDAAQPITIRFVSNQAQCAAHGGVQQPAGQCVGASGRAARCAHHRLERDNDDAGCGHGSACLVAVSKCASEGDWGWGMSTDRNLVGRYTSQTFTLPNTGMTQTLYLRQYDGSTPPQYSPYSSVLNLEV